MWMYIDVKLSSSSLAKKKEKKKTICYLCRKRESYFLIVTAEFCRHHAAKYFLIVIEFILLDGMVGGLSLTDCNNFGLESLMEWSKILDESFINFCTSNLQNLRKKWDTW